MGTAGHSGTGTGFDELSRLGEALPILQIFLGVLMCLLLALGSTLVESKSSGWAEGFRMGSSLNHRGTTLGLERKAFNRLSCSFHSGPDKPSGLVYIHFLPGGSSRWGSHTSQQQPLPWLVLVPAK